MERVTREINRAGANPRLAAAQHDARQPGNGSERGSDPAAQARISMLVEGDGPFAAPACGADPAGVTAF
jgi:hypothetical protein